MKKILLIAAFSLLALPAFAQVKGLTQTLTDDATGLDCTHWKIETEQRNHRHQNLQITLGGYTSSAMRDADKQPPCTRSYNIAKDSLPKGKLVGDLTTADLLALIKATVQPNFVPVLKPDAPAPTPLFKDAKIE